MTDGEKRKRDWVESDPIRASRYITDLEEQIESLKIENNDLKNFIQHNIIDNANDYILSLSN